MRLPQEPPVFPQNEGFLPSLLGLLSHTEFPAFARSAQDRYWNWDDVRRHPIPGGAAPEVAWHALALGRRNNLRELPLLRAGGRPFTYMLHDRVVEYALHVDALASTALGLVNVGARSEQREQLLEGLIDEAVHSSLIEGAAITRSEGRALLEQGRHPNNHAERMVYNNFRTIEWLATVADEPLTVELICEMQRRISEGTLHHAGDAGRVQTPGEDRVFVAELDGQVVHRPPPAAELASRLERLCAFGNADTPWMPAVARSVLLHFQIAHDHPFVDGNGRTARALFFWSMLRQKHWMVRYLSISSEIQRSYGAYVRAYVNSEQTGDTTYFLLYHLDVLKRSMDALATRIRQRQARLGEAEKALHGWPDLNLRQRLLVTAGLRNPEQVLDARTCATRHGVTLQTAHTDLKKLVGYGLFTRSRVGHRWLFRPTANLAHRIERGSPNFK